jgi:hypothetical protein
MSCIAAHAGGIVIENTRYTLCVLTPLVFFFIAGDNIIVGGSDGKLAWCANRFASF